MSDIIKSKELETLKEKITKAVEKSNNILEFNRSIGNPISIKLPPDEVCANENGKKLLLLSVNDLRDIIGVTIDIMCSESVDEDLPHIDDEP